MIGKPRDDVDDDGESALSNVGGLMEERLRLEAWLQALVARRAETPKHVFARVHADYTARLEAVMSRLNGQVEALRTELTTLATRIATLEERQHRARDERAEGELRAHVGELAPDAWTEFVATSDAQIARLAEQHARAVEALRRTREFLTDAERPATPAHPAPSITAAAAPPPAQPIAAPEPKPRPSMSVPEQNGVPKLRPLPGRETANPSVPAQPAPAAARQQKFDELAFLSSVISDGEPATAPAPVPEAPTAPAARAPKAPAQQLAPASVPRPAPRPSAAPAAAAPAARPSAPAPRPSAPAPRPSTATVNPFAQRAAEKVLNADVPRGPMIDATKTGAGLAGNVSGNNPVVLRDKSSDTAKTLKCSECGAANYPTEWYCERCGAELASL